MSTISTPSNPNRIRRFRYVAAAFVALLFMGLVYSWSLFSNPIQTEFGWTSTQTSGIFTVSMIFMSLGMIAAGILERQLPPRAILAITGILMGGGFLTAATVHSLWGLYLTYGVLASFGSGVGTDAVMSTVLKWYPDRSSAVSGGLLMGFGLGSFLLSPPVTVLLEHYSWRQTFILLGAVFLIVMAAAAMVIHAPDAVTAYQLRQRAQHKDKRQKQQSASARDYTPQQMVGRPAFWYFFVWLVLVTSGGLGLLSQAVPAANIVLNAQPMGDASSGTMLATLAMGAVSLCNGFGRLLNGVMWERLGFRRTVLSISFAFVLSMAFCGIAMDTDSYPLLVIGFMLLGLSYGGSMSATASMSSSFFGQRHFAMNYAITVLELVPAAILGPLVIAQTEQATGTFTVAFWIFLGVALVAFGLAHIIREPHVPESMLRAERELMAKETASSRTSSR